MATADSVATSITPTAFPIPGGCTSLRIKNMDAAINITVNIPVLHASGDSFTIGPNEEVIFRAFHNAIGTFTATAASGAPVMNYGIVAKTNSDRVLGRQG